MTNSRRTPFIQELEMRFTHGYAMWFKLIEVMAENGAEKNGGKLEIHSAILRKELNSSLTIVHQFLTFCSTIGQLSVNFSEKKFIIEMPNLLDLKDNYTKDLQVTCKKLAPYIEEIRLEEENIREEKKSPIPPLKRGVGVLDERLFSIFWKAYPKKKSKGQAEKTFAKLNPDEQLVATMVAKIERAKTSDQWRKNFGEFIPNPSTWLNAKGWDDVLEVEISSHQNENKFRQGLRKRFSQTDSQGSPGLIGISAGMFNEEDSHDET